MFIGNLVKLKKDYTNKNHENFVTNAKKEGWIFLVTNIDDEDLDYVIRPIYLDEGNMTCLGKELLVLSDDIEKVELNREELFDILRKQRLPEC